MEKLFLVLTIIALSFYQVKAFKEWWEDSKVFELTTANFEQTVGKDKYVVVKFYTKWCHYCRVMAPEYDKLLDIFKNRDDVLIARLEGSINEEISQKYGIYSFPIVVLYKPGDLHIQAVFQGNRIASVMKEWVETNSPAKKVNTAINDEPAVKHEIPNHEEPIITPVPNIENKNKISNETQKAHDSFDLEMPEEEDTLVKEVESLKQKLESLEKEINEIKDNINNGTPNTNENSKNKNGFQLPSLPTILVFSFFLLILIALFLSFKKYFFSLKKQAGITLHSKV